MPHPIQPRPARRTARPRQTRPRPRAGSARESPQAQAAADSSEDLVSWDGLNFAAFVLLVTALHLKAPSLGDVTLVLGLKRLNQCQGKFRSLLGRQLRQLALNFSKVSSHGCLRSLAQRTF